MVCFYGGFWCLYNSQSDCLVIVCGCMTLQLLRKVEGCLLLRKPFVVGLVRYDIFLECDSGSVDSR